MGFDGTQVVEIACVGQLVEIQDARAFRVNPLENEVRANEASTTGDEDEIFHARLGRAMQHTRVPILIIIAAEREIVPGLGGYSRSGESGLAGGRRTGLIQRRYRAAEMRIWVCSLGICSAGLQPSTL